MHFKKIVFNFNKLNSINDFYQSAKEKLHLPDYFGNNLDALYDCLTGGIYLPVEIKFIHLSAEQFVEFKGLIQTFEDAQESLGGDFLFNYSIAGK